MSSDKIPKGELARTGVVGLTAAKVGIKEIEYLAKKTFGYGNGKQELKDHTDEKIAKIIFKALSYLRGTALKFAQMLSMEIDVLPEAFQKEFSKSCYQVPSLNRALIRKEITTGLGGVPEKLFKSFQSTPFAAASLGQVHAGETTDGAQTATKVQYPGIADTIQSDIKLLRKLITIMPYQHADQNIGDEIEARLMEELDYKLEAQNTRWFKKHLSSVHIEIPDVIDSLSSKTILTTTRLDGKHLEDWLSANPSQALRNHYGQLLADIVQFGLYDLCALHTDPNPGNFLFRDDGTIGILDFGCIKRLDKDYANKFKLFLEVLQHKDISKIRDMYELLGFKLKKKSARATAKDDDVLKIWLDWFSKPLTEKKFSFAENSGYIKEGYKIIRHFRNFFASVNENFIFLDRTWLGLFRFLEKIQAEANLRPDRQLIL